MPDSIVKSAVSQATTGVDLPLPSHPMDSSRIMVGVMQLSRQGELARNAEHPDSLEGVISKTILRKLLSALHFRDLSTISHARRVAQISVGIAESLGWEGRSLRILEVASLLHDIGKIGIPDNILHKPGRFNPDEIDLMALHNSIGFDVLQACRVDGEVLEIMTQAHSLCNGVPEETMRVGRSCLLGARILAVADAYDSLTNDQVYRKAVPHDEAIEKLSHSKGAQFDGNIISVLDRLISGHNANFTNNTTANDLNQFAPLGQNDINNACSMCNIFYYLYMLESLYEGFYLLDSDLRFVVWNHGAERLFGHSSSKLLNQVRTSRLLSYADQYGNSLSDHDCPMHQVVSTGQGVAREAKIKTESGEWVDVELQSIPLRDENGLLVGVAEIFRDRCQKSKTGQFRQLKLQASRDALTNVANRGELESQLALLMTQFQDDPNKSPFSIIFLDIDHFKKINDTHGHGIGDKVLIQVAKLLKDETYSGEIVARYGGEEFVVLCPETSTELAEQRAERIRNSLMKLKFDGVPQLKVTSSFGVTSAEPGDSMSSVLRRADKALYQSKDTGRNKTTSLTNDQLIEFIQQDKIEKEEIASDPWKFEDSFHACVAADMIVFKLGGFVEDQNANLLSVKKGQAVLQTGSYSMLFPFWGNKESSQPIQVVIHFDDDHSSEEAHLRNKVLVTVNITAKGFVRKPAVFQERAKASFKMLRSYFAAE